MLFRKVNQYLYMINLNLWKLRFLVIMSTESKLVKISCLLRTIKYSLFESMELAKF